MEVARIICWLSALAFLTGCNGQHKRPGHATHDSTSAFAEYWASGKLELSSYRLNQSPHDNEVHKRSAVLVYNTTDFSKKKQVEVDNQSSAGRIQVLKLNFSTGLYTGATSTSQMLSVFTPVQLQHDPATLKVSMSSQNLAGHIYTQLNLRGNRYVIKSHSYSDDETDEQFSLRQAFLEDEIWTRIRLDPKTLPVGDVEMVPGLFHLRSNRLTIRPQQAIAERNDTDSSFVYTVVFPSLQRSLSISFEKAFPHRILGWRERWKEGGEFRLTTALLDRTLHTDHIKSSESSYYLRDSLNLPNPYY